MTTYLMNRATVEMFEYVSEQLGMLDVQGFDANVVEGLRKLISLVTDPSPNVIVVEGPKEEYRRTI